MAHPYKGPLTALRYIGVGWRQST